MRKYGWQIEGTVLTNTVYNTRFNDCVLQKPRVSGRSFLCSLTKLLSIIKILRTLGFGGPNGLVDIATGYRLDGPGFGSR